MTPREQLLAASEDLCKAGRLLRDADDQEILLECIEIAEGALTRMRSL